MDRLLMKLGIEANNDISVLKEELEQKQMEYLNKLDRVSRKSDKTMNEKKIEKELASDLVDIEEAINTFAWMLKKINTGLNITKTPPETNSTNNPPKGSSEEGEKEIPEASETDPQKLCDEAEKYIIGGRVVKRDYEKAFVLFSRAMKLGSMRGQVGVAKAYLQGRGIPQDVSRGLELLENASAQGYRQALIDLGDAYAEGIGVIKDDTKAYDWYGKAMKQGSEIAMDRIMRGAEKGIARAQYYFGYMFEVGCKYCIKNMTYAKDWYRRAAYQWDADARKRLLNFDMDSRRN